MLNGWHFAFFLCASYICSHPGYIPKHKTGQKFCFCLYSCCSLFWGRSNIQVLHINISYAKEESCPPSDLRIPVLVCNTHFNLLLKTLLNYKTSPWIQSLHTQKSLIKKIQQNSSKECITYSWLIHKLKLQNQPLDSNLHAQKSLEKKKKKDKIQVGNNEITTTKLRFCLGPQYSMPSLWTQMQDKLSGFLHFHVKYIHL